MTIDEILKNEEYQIFDRKSIQIAPTALSDTICAFANADGGRIAIGVSDKKRRIEGVDNHISQLNELLRVPLDYCNPTVPITTEMVECVNYQGQSDHVLVMNIEASPLLHANHADEVFLRVGDKSKKLTFQDRLTLMYAKGLRYYEDEPVADATIEDIDLEFVRTYCARIGYQKSAEEYLRENKKFITGEHEQASTAAVLLFGKHPQQFFPRARIRFIRYDGIEARVGKDMNVIKDVIFEGRILEQVEKAVDYIKTQMKEKTYLGHDGIFVTEEEYSEFVRTEIVVNAATHRDYGIKGTDIQIKMFDDRLEVDSPGTFAGMVKKDNIRYTHFSRNPKIAAFLKDYGYVKEYGEGVDRMCRELEAVGLPDPTYNNSTFILKTTVMSAAFEEKTTNDPSILLKNASIGQKDASIHGKDGLTAMLQTAARNGELSGKDAADAQAIIDNMDVMQVLTSREVMKILSCQTTKARLVLKKMESQKLIKPIQGKGKGKYILNIIDQVED